MNTCLTVVLVLFCGVLRTAYVVRFTLTQSYNVNQITKKGLVVPWRLSQVQELQALETCKSKDLGKTLFCDES